MCLMCIVHVTVIGGLSFFSETSKDLLLIIESNVHVCTVRQVTRSSVTFCPVLHAKIILIILPGRPRSNGELVP